VQKWFVVRLTDANAKVDPSRMDERKGRPEFRAHAWIAPSELLEKAPAFRLPVYEPLIGYIQSIPRIN
jgi:hypothetical protein